MESFEDYAKRKIENAIDVIPHHGLFGLWCDSAFAAFPKSAVFWDMSDEHGSAEAFLGMHDDEIRAFVSSLPEGVSSAGYFSMSPSERVAWLVRTYALIHREEYSSRVARLPSSFRFENSVLGIGLSVAVILIVLS